MARSNGPKLVQCYLCGHRFEVGAMAQSTSCPGCNKPVIVADEVIKKVRGPIRELRTCGKITVQKKARLMAEHIVAHGGIENLGIIEAKQVNAGPALLLGPKSEFKGELHTRVLVMESGAKVKPSLFHVPSDPTGLLTQREKPEKTSPKPDTGQTADPTPAAKPAVNITGPDEVQQPPREKPATKPEAKKPASKKAVSKKTASKKATKKKSATRKKKPPPSGDRDDSAT